MRMEEEMEEKFKYRAPKGLDQEDIDFFEERARTRLIREIENEEADLSELEKVFRSQRGKKPEELVPQPPVVVTAAKPKPALSKNSGLQVKVVAKLKTAGSVSSSSSSSNPSPSSKRKLEDSEETSKAKKVQSDVPSSSSSSSSKSAKPSTSKPSSSTSSSSSTSHSSSSSSAPPELGPAATASANPLGGLLAYDEDDE